MIFVSRNRLYSRFSRYVLPFFLLLLTGGCRNETPEQNAELVFRMAVQHDSSNKVWVATDLFRRELERRSNGRIRVMFYDSGVLGAERQILEACYLDVIEVVQVTSSVVTTIGPVFSTLDMPYLFVSEEHHQKVLNGPIGRELLDSLSGIRLQGLAFYSCGFRDVFNSKRPVYGPDDLRGMKIRAMESPVMLNSINSMGASATPLDASEVYSALKTGVVDGAENNPQVFISQHYSNACKFYSLTGHFANQHVLIANKKWLDSLKPEFRELIRAVARDIIPEYNRAWNEAVAEAMTRMAERNVSVNGVDDKRAFIERVQPIYEEYRDSVPPELVLRIRKEADSENLLPLAR
ncbi:TRAP transporter substrate-binding protein DctP [bacterium]|nr:TRAP transporter substrate-binding protein DctP [bacterium]